MLADIGGVAALQKLQARKNATEKYVAELEKVDDKLRQLFQESLDDARRGFKLSIIMDALVFAIGLALVSVSAALILRQGGDLSQWAGVGVSGGAGVLAVVYGTLIAKPRVQVRAA